MEKINTYFDFAENDFLFFEDAYRHGIVGTPMAAMGQNICERYFKHLISAYSNPETDEEDMIKTNILRTHSLIKLMHYIEEDMGLEIPKDTKNTAKLIDGFYFSTRYPGENSFLPTEEDIDDAYFAANAVRGFVQECTQKLENRAVEEIAEHDTGDDDMDDLL